MNALKNVIMGLLLLAILSCNVAKAAKTSELLQKGLYAEEVEGNIDSAIKIYSQIIQDKSAPRDHIAQALYRQGLCYMKIKNDQAAKADFEKLAGDYADQAEIVEKVRSILDDLSNFDPAALMPPDTLAYIELGTPGKQIETILNMLKGTPLENPLAAMGGKQNQQIPGNMMSAFFNPSMMAEFKKIRGSAIGITGIAQNNPPCIAVLYPGKSDALRGLILAGLGMLGQQGQPVDDMNIINMPNDYSAAYDDKVVIMAHPVEQLKWCIKQYRGLTHEPTLASNNKTFAKISKQQRQSNALTAWINVDDTYNRLLGMFPPGQIPKEILWIDGCADFNHIDYITYSDSIETDHFIDTLEIVFKDGHHCLAYDLIRTPNINRSALQAVPADAVALASFAMSAQNEKQAQTVRDQLKNVTGLDIGREIFDNIEQVTLFVMQPGAANEFFPGSFGIVLTSHSPEKTREILTRILTITNSIYNPESSAAGANTSGRFQIAMLNKDTPLFCYLEQQGNSTILSLNPDITKACLKAIKDHNSVCNSGPLSDSIAKMPAGTSKLIICNAGGTIRIVAPLIIQSIGKENRETLQNNFNQLATACDKSVIELRTDEQLNNFMLTRKITGLPPLSQIFIPITQIAKTVEQSKTLAVSRKLQQAAPAVIMPAAKSPVIDGQADEVWANANQYMLANVIYNSPSSPNDLAAGYKAMWDQNNLYVLLNVKDDVLKNDSPEAYNDDCVEVFIDAKNSKSAQYGPTDYAYIIRCDKANPEIRENNHNQTAGVECAMEKIEGGYQMEIKFPWSTLGTKSLTGSKIGLDIHVNDDDDGGERDTKITWHDTTDNAWQNPQVFGNAELAGMLGWWKFDETQGKIAADSSGNGNNGTLIGNPAWRPQGGKIGGAIDLDGKADYVQIDNEAPFDISGQITISAWINVKSVPQEWTAIVTKGDTAWRMSTDFDNNIFHFGIGSGEDNYLNGRTAVTSGQWHHVLCVYDGTKMTIYVDGKLDSTKPHQGGIATNDFPVCIGENIEIKNRFWHGMIDDVRVYNYALSEKEILALAHPGEDGTLAKAQ